VNTTLIDVSEVHEAQCPAVPASAFATPAVETENLPAGELILRSAIPLGSVQRSAGEWLRDWAIKAPNRVFLAERNVAGGWARLTYAQAWNTAEAVAQALLDRALSTARPVVVLSGNSIDHAVLMLGCYLAGVPIAPVSVAYSLVCTDPCKVQDILDVMRPGLVFAEDGDAFQPTLDSLDLHGAEVVVSRGGKPAWTRFDALTRTTPGRAVGSAFAATGPDTVAKILFTSGSTGQPKGVPNTHRMICSNQQALSLIWPFTNHEPPVLVDWLPWSHTFGGNHNFHLVLRSGGTLYIDAGKPAPGLFETSLRNLVEVSPTIYLNVPLGFTLLADALEADPQAARAFFRRLRLIMYAAAALPQDTWDRLAALARRFAPGNVALTTSWGATETAPAATSAHFPLDAPGTIGVPLPGTEIKLTPVNNRLELRVRGPNIAPGYLTSPAETSRPAGSFDAYGFYRTGDAGRLADPSDPAKGVIFDGRISEDFKLATGTWVHTAAVRMAALQATAPLVQDVVVTGEGRDQIGIMAWPTPAGKALGDSLAAELRRRLAEAQSASPRTASHTIRHLLVLTDPPSIDAGEITDKGYINQRAVLRHRAALVDALYNHNMGVPVH
jgi:feruloyl-CoA synthase